MRPSEIGEGGVLSGARLALLLFDLPALLKRVLLFAADFGGAGVLVDRVKVLVEVLLRVIVVRRRRPILADFKTLVLRETVLEGGHHL